MSCLVGAPCICSICCMCLWLQQESDRVTLQCWIVCSSAPCSIKQTTANSTLEVSISMLKKFSLFLLYENCISVCGRSQTPKWCFLFLAGSRLTPAHLNGVKSLVKPDFFPHQKLFSLRLQRKAGGWTVGNRQCRVWHAVRVVGTLAANQRPELTQPRPMRGLTVEQLESLSSCLSVWAMVKVKNWRWDKHVQGSQ